MPRSTRISLDKKSPPGTSKDLVAEVQHEQQAHEYAKSDPEAGDQEHDAEMRSQRRLLSDKDGTSQNVENDVARMQVQREGDMQAV